MAIGVASPRHSLSTLSPTPEGSWNITLRRMREADCPVTISSEVCGCERWMCVRVRVRVCVPHMVAEQS